MAKITHYEILGHSDSQQLEVLVRRALAQGYQPLGGVAAVVAGNNMGFYQVMVGYTAN